MSDILKNPSFKASHNKTAFDVSRTLKFTSPCGLLSPVYYDFLLPGDKVKFSTEMLSRTQPLVKPAMLQVRQDVDWFFVPMNQLFQFFEDLQYNIKDVKTDFVDSIDKRMFMPNFDLKDYVNAFYDEGYMDKTLDEIPLSARDIFGVPKCFNADRLMQLLGFGGWSCLRNIAVDPEGSDPLAVVNVFLLAAYHKIYMDVYRLTDREQNDPSLYNFDSAYNTQISALRVLKLLRMHYRAWDKDYFTNNVPSPNFIASNDINGAIGSEYSLFPISNDVDQYNDLAAFFGQQYNPVDTIEPLRNYSPLQDGNTIPNLSRLYLSNYIEDGNNITVDSLNYLYALNKQAEITRRAAKHFDAQTLAHYGFKVPTGISGEVYRLGSDSSNIKIGDVVSTAETDNGALGAMAGTGFAYNENKQKSFVAPCHGILMAIHSVIPECDYTSDGLDKFNTKRVPSDYYQPEFDRVGMQPLFEYESVFADSQNTSPNAIMGFQYRYSEYKMKHNVAALGFLDTDVSHYSAYRDFKFYLNDQAMLARNQLFNYLIDPGYLDNCFEVSYRFTSQHETISRSTAYARDPFIHMFRFHVYKSSIMSTYGLPQL